MERNDESTQQANRQRKVTVRFTNEEYERLDNALKKTTFRKLSYYVRAILFNRKVTVYERNKSLDEFMEEVVLLRTELNRIGNNFNQVTRKINSAKDSGELRAMAVISSAMQQKLLDKISEIQGHINKFSDQWLQRS